MAKTILEVVAVAIGAAYTLAAFFQLRSMNNQLEQMRDARRAWLGTSSDIIPVAPAPASFTPLKAGDGTNWLNMWMKYKVDIKNVGATPALEEHDAFVLYDLVRVWNGNATWEKTWCADQYKTYRSRNSATSDPINSAIFPQDAKPISGVMTGAFQTGKPTDPESAIIAGVLGCIIYRDIFGKEWPVAGELILRRETARLAKRAAMKNSNSE